MDGLIAETNESIEDGEYVCMHNNNTIRDGLMSNDPSVGSFVGIRSMCCTLCVI